MTLLKQWQDAHARACRERNEAEDQAKATLDAAVALQAALELALAERDEARHELERTRKLRDAWARSRIAATERESELEDTLGLALAERDEAREKLQRAECAIDLERESAKAAKDAHRHLESMATDLHTQRTCLELQLADMRAERDEAREKLQRAECAIDLERESAKAARDAFRAKCEALGQARAALATMRDALRDACRDRDRACEALDNAHAVLTAAKGATL